MIMFSCAAITQVMLNSKEENSVPIGEMARRTAQQLLQQWANTKQSNTAAPDRDGTQSPSAVQSMLIPPLYFYQDLQLTETKRIRFAPQGGGTSFSWSFDSDNSSPSRAKDIITQGKQHCNVQSPPAASTTGGDASPNYGLSPEELAYFGLSDVEQEATSASKRSSMKRDEILAILRGNARNHKRRQDSVATTNAAHQRDNPKSSIPEFQRGPYRAATPPSTTSLQTTPSGGGVKLKGVIAMEREEESADDTVVSPADDTVVTVSQNVALAEQTTITSTPRGRSQTFLSKQEKPINLRFLKPNHCDATAVKTLIHMFSVSKAIMSAKSAELAERKAYGDEASAIHSIDISGTRLGKQGRNAVPVLFGADGQAIPKSGGLTFWPDEREITEQRQRFLETSGGKVDDDLEDTYQAVMLDVAGRSLALAYIAPTLYLKKANFFSIRILTASNCDFTSHDASALAVILRWSNSAHNTNYCCFLESVDLSNNAIDDQGAENLKKAIKYAPQLKVLQLKGNPITNRSGVLNEIKRRLRNNKNGVANLGPFQSLFHK